VDLPKAPPPKDQKITGELGELERQFEEEEKAKAAPKPKPTPDKVDTDLDEILRKLSSGSAPKKGGGAK
jgi:hypothetical protein